jgi:predicted Zn-dependent protease
MIDALEKRFVEAAPAADFASLRFLDERTEVLGVRQGVLETSATGADTGVMLTVMDGGGIGYAATSDLSLAGLQEAGRRAHAWARRSAGIAVTDFRTLEHAPRSGTYETPVRTPWASVGLVEKVDRLRAQCERLKTDDRIVDWWAVLVHVDSEMLYLDTGGSRVHQSFEMLMPNLGVIANEGTETQKRSLHGQGAARQGGLEVLEDLGFDEAPGRLTEEALQLLAAPDCPTGPRDVLLAPDQMILQIHESIGHPLELDRILGDERNFAGTSFVTTDMFGSYRYGSDLLNVVWDPTRPDQLASYAYDDEGRPATREYIIEKGILLRALGGGTSQARTDVPGVATSRASGWDRPPIDRMANLNLEAGDTPFEDLVAQTERGVYMATNSSWSIDDSRNKFQFGCEYGRLIEDGELTTVVKKPNYRGISATFWRNLKGVGDEATFQVLGTPNCGKGEPNQLIRVAHASPVCLFADVEVFGGA